MRLKGRYFSRESTYMCGLFEYDLITKMTRRKLHKGFANDRVTFVTLLEYSPRILQPMLSLPIDRHQKRR